MKHCTTVLENKEMEFKVRVDQLTSIGYKILNCGFCINKDNENWWAILDK